MFRSHSGAKKDDSVQTCEQGEQAVDVTAVPEKKMSKKKLLGWIGGGVAALVVIVFAVLFIWAGSAKGAANKYMKAAYKTGNSKAVVNCVPKKVLNDILDQADMEKKELIEKLNRQYQDNRENYEEAKISYIVTYSFSFTEEELEEIEDYYEDLFALDMDITSAREVGYKVTVQGKDGVKILRPRILSVKVNGKWCVLDALKSGIV